MARLVEIADGSFETLKRARMEATGVVEKVPVPPYHVDTSRWFTAGEPAARTVPLQPEHGAPFCQGGGSKRPREINVPNEKASAGGGAAGESAAGESVAGEGATGKGAPGGDAAGAGAARGGAADGRYNYCVKVRHENNGDLSFHWTEDLMQAMEDRKFALTLKSMKSGGKVLLTWNAISDGV